MEHPFGKLRTSCVTFQPLVHPSLLAGEEGESQDTVGTSAARPQRQSIPLCRLLWTRYLHPRQSQRSWRWGRAGSAWK